MEPTHRPLGMSSSLIFRFLPLLVSPSNQPSPLLMLFTGDSLSAAAEFENDRRLDVWEYEVDEPEGTLIENKRISFVTGEAKESL